MNGIAIAALISTGICLAFVIIRLLAELVDIGHEMLHRWQLNKYLDDLNDEER